MKNLGLMLIVLAFIFGCSEKAEYKTSAVSVTAQGGKTIETSRRRDKFNEEWKFIKKDLQGAQVFDFDDSAWKKVNLPHDWAIEGPFTKDVSFQCGYLPFPGVGWYRKELTIPSDAKCVRIEFDGVMRNAKVWLNGEYIGGRPYGYSSFSFDLTDYVRRGQKNVIAVRVENEDNSSRWYPGSGIYRNVCLTFTGEVHVEQWGTYITTKKVSDRSASVNVETQIQNQSNRPQDVVLETIIYDAQGNNVAKSTEKKRIKKDASLEFRQELKVLNPIRWDIQNPYLYKAVSNVKIDDRIVDRYETKYGIRTFRLDPNQGFFLNGRHLKIKGVNLHHGLGPLGIAFSRRAAERQLEIMKEMGCNAIRTAHNPPAPEQLDLCDEMGLLVIDETFDEWEKPKVPNGYNKFFDKWAEKDTRALLKRDRNRPSVIFWSTGNEIMELDTPQGKKNAKRFYEICKEMDPTRPVISGIHLSIKLDRELADCFDVLGLNYWQDRYEEIHKKFPDKPLLTTESSAVISTRGEYHFPVERKPEGYHHKSYQISSYDIANCGFGALPDEEFKLQQKHSFLMGEFVWSGFDYHGEPDPYENMWPAHSSYFGIVDMSGFKKDRFYLYQSQWSDEPMIHLLPHWNWEGREGEVTPVYCYTNCASAELFVNGKSFGKKEKTENKFRLKWNEVVYQSGSIKVVGYNHEGQRMCDKEIKTAGKPHNIELIADRETIKANGEDLCFVKVRIVDKEGNLCPLADNLVHFKLEGDGEIACVGNGNPISHEPYQAKYRKAFHGLCIVVVRSTQQEGCIELTATSEGLLEKQILLKTESCLATSESAVYAAEAPKMQWHKGHGTDNGDHVHYGLQTSDGGYIMTGETSEGKRGSDILVVKTDANGDLQWQKIVGLKDKRDYANFVTEVSDGFLVAGALHDTESQKRVLLKFNFNGEIVWQKTYASDGNGEIRGIVITGDGGIVATGYVGSKQAGYRFIADDGEGFIMKTDSKGNLLWEKRFSAASHGIRVGEITGGFAIAANVWLNEGEKRHQNVCLILTDSEGKEIFSETYGGDGDDQVFDFAVTTDGGYIFSGHSRSPSYGTVNWDYYLLKIGHDKKEQWHKTFGQPRGYDAKFIHDESYGVKQTPDGGYVVVGGSGDEYRYSESGRPGGPSDLWRAYVVRTDAEGNLLWQGLYGELQGNNAGEYINLTSDGGYIIFTDSDTAGSMGSNNFGIMKIAPDKSMLDD